MPHEKQANKKITEKKSWLSKLLAGFISLAKFILDLADDLVVAVKEFLPLTEKLMYGIMGATFGFLCFYLSWESAKELWKDFRRPKDKPHKNYRRMARNALSLGLYLAASGLAIALIIYAFTSLPVLGVAFFPFAITSTLLLTSLLRTINIFIDLVCPRKPLSAEKTKHLKRELFYQCIDTIAFGIIVGGLALTTFVVITGSFYFLPLHFVPLIIIGIGATCGVVGKLFEYKIPQKLASFLGRIFCCTKDVPQVKHVEKNRPKIEGKKIHEEQNGAKGKGNTTAKSEIVQLSNNNSDKKPQDLSINFKYSGAFFKPEDGQPFKNARQNLNAETSSTHPNELNNLPPPVNGLDNKQEDFSSHITFNQGYQNTNLQGYGNG